MTLLALLVLAVPLLVVAIAIAIVIETRTGEIPNWLTFGGLIAAVPLAFLSGGLERAGIAFGIATVVTLFAFRRGAMGGGAMKLTVAVAALTCWQVVAATLGASLLAFAMVEARSRRSRPAGTDHASATMRSSPVVAAGLVLGLLARHFWA